jgi:hypothetical protein
MITHIFRLFKNKKQILYNMPGADAPRPPPAAVKLRFTLALHHFSFYLSRLLEMLRQYYQE